MSAPLAPGNPEVTYYSDSEIELVWENPGGSTAAASVTVRRWSATTSAWTTIAVLNVATLGYYPLGFVDTTAPTNDRVRYDIIATSASGESSASGNYASSTQTTSSTLVYTAPTAPTAAVTRYSATNAVTFEWTPQHFATDAGYLITPYKNGVAQSAVVGPAGTTSYAYGADGTSSYYFKIQVAAPNSATSAQVTGSTATALVAPNAPTGVAPTGARDLTQTISLSWTHSPGGDNARQTKWQVQHRLLGAGSWTVASAVTSGASSGNAPWSTSTYANGQTVEYQVRTYGASATAGAWSATATIIGSTTPTVAITAPATSHPKSQITVEWSYFDAESTAQQAFLINLKNASGTVIETINGTGTATSQVLATVAPNGASYTVEVSAQDTSGLWSDVATKSFTVAYIPPAESTLTITVDEDTGAAVLDLTPGASDGTTILPATSATVERRLWDDSIEAYGDWELVAANVAPDALLVDPAAPVYDDGHYRVTTFSAAPSSLQPVTVYVPTPINKWAYLSGGDDFEVVAKFWANIQIDWKASRTKALHYFAGRTRPVLYSGEQSEWVMNCTAIITDDASDPHKFRRLAQMEGPVMFRAPGNRRVFGALSEVSVTRIQPQLHSLSFSIQEVYK